MVLVADKITILEQDIAFNIRQQLNGAWTPQYCKKDGIATFDGDVVAVQSSMRSFCPHKLNVPHVTDSQQQYSQGKSYYYINDILHKNIEFQPMF